MILKLYLFTFLLPLLFFPVLSVAVKTTTQPEQIFRALDQLNKSEHNEPNCQEASCLNNTVSAPETEHNICPEFLIKQAIFQDKRGSINRESPHKQCTGVTNRSVFASPAELESYIRSSPYFSELNTQPISACLFQPVKVSQVGQYSAHEFEYTLPEDKHRIVVAEYYASLYRLNQGLSKNLGDIAAIDQIIGDKNDSLLKGVSCSKLPSLSTSPKEHCEALQACPQEENRLRDYARATFTAMEGIRAIDKRIKKLKGPRNRHAKKNEEKISELETERENIQNMFPWIVGKKFKAGYNEEDFNDFDSSKDNTQLENKMAALIKEQFTHTREQLVEHQSNLHKAVECLKTADKSVCHDVDVDKVIAKTPAMDNALIFERERIKTDRTKNLSPSETTNNLRMSESDILFSTVDCLQTQRKGVKEMNETLAIAGLDVIIVVGTVGIGSAFVGTKLAATLAARAGRTLSTAQRLSKAKKLQNFGVVGVDASFSSPYMQQAMSQCEDLMNQLESTVQETEKKEMCSRLPIQSKLTADLKGCLLQATLASLPITLPLAGVAILGIKSRKAIKAAEKKDP